MPSLVPTIFLLSPADCSGKRAAMLFRPAAEFELAVRLRTPEGAPLGEVFSFVSGLYFRGKLAYAERFGRSDAGPEEPLVITSGWGLRPSSTRVTIEDLQSFACVPIDIGNRRYREPLEADVGRLAATLAEDTRVVLLGSIATPKYVDLLLGILGDRLCFPAEFVGLGDMSRGSILLRAAREGVELNYTGARGARRTLAAKATVAARKRGALP